jgi:hypothetical protein
MAEHKGRVGQVKDIWQLVAVPVLPLDKYYDSYYRQCQEIQRENTDTSSSIKAA